MAATARCMLRDSPFGGDSDRRVGADGTGDAGRARGRAAAPRARGPRVAEVRPAPRAPRPAPRAPRPAPRAPRPARRGSGASWERRVLGQALPAGQGRGTWDRGGARGTGAGHGGQGRGAWDWAGLAGLASGRGSNPTAQSVPHAPLRGADWGRARMGRGAPPSWGDLPGSDGTGRGVGPAPCRESPGGLGCGGPCAVMAVGRGGQGQRGGHGRHRRHGPRALPHQGGPPAPPLPHRPSPTAGAVGALRVWVVARTAPAQGARGAEVAAGPWRGGCTRGPGTGAAGAACGAWPQLGGRRRARRMIRGRRPPDAHVG